MEVTVKSTGNVRLDWWNKFNAMKKRWHSANYSNTDSYNWYKADDIKKGDDFDHTEESLSAWEKQEVLCSLYL